jgi:TonB family protein
LYDSAFGVLRIPMEIKKTLTLSIFFHVTLSAALLLSSGLGGGGDALYSKVFFVDLSAYSDMPENADPMLGRDGAVPEKEAVEKTSPVKEERGSKGEKTKKEHGSEEVGTLGVSSPDEAEEGLDRSDNLAKTVKQSGYDSSASKTVKEEAEINAAHASLSGRGEGVFKAGEGVPDIIEMIGMAIERAKTYPVLARKRGIEGTVYITFRVSPEGRPMDIEVLKSSGHRLLDTATLNVVRKAAPYPYIDSLIEVPVIYKLRD